MDAILQYSKGYYFVQHPSDKFTMDGKVLLFKLRTSMDSAKNNFSSMYSELRCDLCDENVLQNTAHLLDCQLILDKGVDTEVHYKHIFYGFKEQLQAIKIFKQVYEIQQKIEFDLIGNLSS